MSRFTEGVLEVGTAAGIARGICRHMDRDKGRCNSRSQWTLMGGTSSGKTNQVEGTMPPEAQTQTDADMRMNLYAMIMVMTRRDADKQKVH